MGKTVKSRPDSGMCVIEYAMEIEKESLEYYADLADSAMSQGVRDIFQMLVDEKRRHYETLRKMSNSHHGRIEGSDILRETKRVFAEMKREDFEDAPTNWPGEYRQSEPFDIAQIEEYKMGRQIEQKSIDFFREKAAMSSDPAEKQMLLDLVEEEKKHYFLLDNIIDFVVRPRQWLENAEFVHLDDY